MGRCGRNKDNGAYVNRYCIIFTLNDYVYLIERLFKIDDNESHSKTKNMISIDEERRIAINNLNNICRMMVCRIGCWHNQLETISSNPLKYHNNTTYSPCGNMCPYCDGSQSKYIKSVSKDGVSEFLAQTLLLQSSEKYTPSTLAKKLIDYPQVGKRVYGRQHSLKVEKNSDAYMTILQLLCNNIIEMEVKEDKKPTSSIKLSLTRHFPHYLYDEYWTYIDHF